MSVIHNERTKLLANSIDRASTSCVTVGVLAPSAAAIYTAPGTFVSSSIFLIGTGIWLFAAIALHLAARRTLSGLKQ
ncbi:hypothetical protein B5P45_26430 [Phyllobacterium zundukense]|uniref:Uncharacterized protein n=1 Tax=Phyllobacterium zundukense TaxID=1867719 RepID=A0A2N9VSR8_9HYPH|nr:hypothetical protein B5P45_26430 [Phyllobacterium zundukense]